MTQGPGGGCPRPGKMRKAGTGVAWRHLLRTGTGQQRVRCRHRGARSGRGPSRRRDRTGRDGASARAGAQDHGARAGGVRRLRDPPRGQPEAPRIVARRPRGERPRGGWSTRIVRSVAGPRGPIVIPRPECRGHVELRQLRRHRQISGAVRFCIRNGAGQCARIAVAVLVNPALFPRIALTRGRAGHRMCGRARRPRGWDRAQSPWDWPASKAARCSGEASDWWRAFQSS